MQLRQLAGLALGTLLGLAGTAAVAAGFTSRSAFLLALPGPATTLDFEALPAGTTLASGTGSGGIVFTYNLGGELLKVTNADPAVSGVKSLGSTDAGILQDGDNLTLTFSNRNALGLVIITLDPLEDGDLTLTAGASTAAIATNAVQQTLSDGAKVYFLGVVEPVAGFASATLTTTGGGYFFYNLDDVVTAAAQDTDGDGIADSGDNCQQIANSNQCDSDGDGYGNRCDGDLNNNGSTNAQDTALFRQQLGQPSVGPTYNKADLNCNGAVNGQDTALFRQRLGFPPGPSGLNP